MMVQMYRKTKGGLWRKVDAGGNWFRSDSTRPETLISKVWEQIKRSKRKGMDRKQSAIIEMEKIIATKSRYSKRHKRPEPKKQARKREKSRAKKDCKDRPSNKRKEERSR